MDTLAAIVGTVISRRRSEEPLETTKEEDLMSIALPVPDSTLPNDVFYSSETILPGISKKSSEKHVGGRNARRFPFEKDTSA